MLNNIVKAKLKFRECSFIIGGADGSKMGGLRKIDQVRGGIYENYLTPIGGSTKKNDHQ